MNKPNVKSIRKVVPMIYTYTTLDSSLQVGDLKPLSLELGCIKQSYAILNNIYILSERNIFK